MNNLIKDAKEEFTSYNVKEFANEKVNVLLITGYSGSGKSTLAERFSFIFNIIHIELDDIDPKTKGTYEQKEAYESQVFIDFFKKYPDMLEKVNSYDAIKNRKEIFDTFIPFCIKWCMKDKENKYIIEGTQIYEFPETIDIDLPIIIMNTSAEESSKRKYQRSVSYNNEITSKQNIKKLEYFSGLLKEKKDGDNQMLKVSDATTANYKIFPMTMDLIYKYKNNKTNHIGNCKYDRNSNGLIITTSDKRKLIGYIVVKGGKLLSLEVLQEYMDEGFTEKLIRLAIDRFGLNEVTALLTKKRIIKLLLSIGFKVINKDDTKVILKLDGILTRKNDYLDMNVRRETVNNNNSTDQQFNYYFSKVNNGKLIQIGKVSLIPSQKYIVEVELYNDYNNYDYLKKLLDFATVEKNCINTRIIFGAKEKLEQYEKYGFKVVKKVKNKNGKFYVLELVEKVKFETDEELMEYLQENIIQTEYTMLMTPLEVEKQLCGSSHDQAQFILEKMPLKYNPYAILVLEKSKTNKVMKSYTIVYYKKNDKYYWIENCMEKAIGINGPYDSIDDLEMAIESKFDFVNKKEDTLDFIPVYVTFSKPVALNEYIKAIVNVEGV